MYARIVRSQFRHSAYRTILQPLMIAFFVEMRHGLLKRTTEGLCPTKASPPSTESSELRPTLRIHASSGRSLSRRRERPDPQY